MRIHGSAFSIASVLLLLTLVGLGCASAGPERIRSTQSDETSWVEVRTATGFNWSEAVTLMPDAVDRIDRVLRNRAVYRQEGFGFGHLMLGPGALYPYHSHSSPEAYHVLSGVAEWSVDGETRRVGPGTTIYHAPYADHRWTTVSEEPLRVVWAQWVPDGDRAGMVSDAVRRRGASSTGAFFTGETRSTSILPTKLAAPVGETVPGSIFDDMKAARSRARAREGARPPIRAFVDSVGVPWNTELPGLRWRAVFGTPDLEWGHVEIRGPGTRKIPASAVPWLLHVLSGDARIEAGGDDAVDARAGTSVVIQPGEGVEVRFEEAPDGGWDEVAPLRAFWVRWTPAGDLGYWARDYFLVEPMPEPPPGATLPKDVPFFR